MFPVTYFNQIRNDARVLTEVHVSLDDLSSFFGSHDVHAGRDDKPRILQV